MSLRACSCACGVHALVVVTGVRLTAAAAAATVKFRHAGAAVLRATHRDYFWSVFRYENAGFWLCFFLIFVFVDAGQGCVSVGLLFFVVVLSVPLCVLCG